MRVFGKKRVMPNWQANISMGKAVTTEATRLLEKNRRLENSREVQKIEGPVKGAPYVHREKMYMIW